MVLLPLPLSPARATISCRLMTMFASSTACRVLREKLPPILKCFVKPRVSSSGGASSFALAVAGRRDSRQSSCRRPRRFRRFQRFNLYLGAGCVQQAPRLVGADLVEQRLGHRDTRRTLAGTEG